MQMDRMASGWINGFIGVVIFSGSLPATRLAVMQFDPVFLTVARAAIAGALALCVLLASREKHPLRGDMVSLVIVAFGVVVGFPLLTALALQHITSAHSIVFIGLLPLSTAIFGVMRGGERPKPAFWIFSALGSALVVGFAVTQGLTASPVGDALMLASIIVCGLGYAEGAKLSRTLGGWQVISWALVFSLPVMIALAIFIGRDFRRHCVARVAQPGLCIVLQHVDRFRLLVSGLGPRRHRRGRPIAIVATVLRSGARGHAAARTGYVNDAGRHRRCDLACDGRAEVQQLASPAPAI
jgi:drug/metabolite transporter (DMT)-like permease